MAQDPLVQKLKGKAQKAVGEYQIRSGKGLKGGITRAKGELNEKIAEARMKLGKNVKDLDENFEEKL